MSDSGVSAEKRTYYRYYKGTYDASTNPGHDHALKYVYGFEGVRGYDWITWAAEWPPGSSHRRPASWWGPMTPRPRPPTAWRSSKTFYDEMGRVWKSQRHEIDVSDGSDDDNLETLTWYDAEGRRVKTEG